MPCPPDPRERNSRLICDVDSEVKALHKQASTMRDTLAMLARHGAEHLDPEREDLIEPPTLPVPEEPTYNDVRRAEFKGRSAKKRYEILCCRLGTQIARFAKGPRLAALSAHERKQVTECLDIHRTHRHADRDTVVRVARQQGHYDRAVMAKWLPDERLMTVRSSLQPRSLDKAIARLDPDSRASFDLEVEALAKAQEADDREARDRQKRYLNSRLRHKAEARAQTDIACPMHHCEGTLYTKGRREEEPAGWQIDLLGPSSERTVSAACDTCTWYGCWSGDMSTEPHWSYKAPVHPRLTRFMTRYPHGPATARQRRSMTELLEGLYKEHRLCQEVRKHVGIRVPRPAHPEETRFETFAKRYRVTETKRCPACGKKALQAQPVVLRHGNPMTPATDVDMDREVRCLSCGHVFWD